MSAKSDATRTVCMSVNPGYRNMSAAQVGILSLEQIRVMQERKRNG